MTEKLDSPLTMIVVRNQYEKDKKCKSIADTRASLNIYKHEQRTEICYAAFKTN